jgi:glycerol-3-phosphate O-acyltransferase
VAAVYRNSAIHALVMRAIAELALLAVARSPDGSALTAWDEALRLRELLKFDFFFARRREFKDELRAELELIHLDAASATDTVTPADARRWLEHARLPVAHLVLRPYLDAYAVVADRLLADDPDEALDEPAFLDECLRVGRQWVLERRLASEESLSAEIFRTALKLARHRGLLDSDSPDLDARRRAFAAELEDVGGDLAAVAALAPG